MVSEDKVEYTVAELEAAGHSTKDLRLPAKRRLVAAGESIAKRELGNTIRALAQNADWRVCEEFQFAPPRRWKADWAIAPSGGGSSEYTILIEFEGGRWQTGFHQTSRYSADATKYNEAALEGFVVLRFTADMVVSGLAAEQIARALL